MSWSSESPNSPDTCKNWCESNGSFIKQMPPPSPPAERTPTVDEDVRLMLSFQQGDVHDFERLMERHYKSVFNLANRFLSDRSAAEDVAQNVFLQIFRSAAGYRPTASFTTWLYTITRNACYSEIRRRGRRPGSLSGEAAGSPHAEARDDLEQAELQAAVRRAIAALPENQRMAVILRRYHELSYDQIATAMNTSVGAVKALLHRAREALKEKLRSFTDR